MAPVPPSFQLTTEIIELQSLI